jgi:beta-ureidopropionase / N-carbamoyl-L-amino-acid hydrolase
MTEPHGETLREALRRVGGDPDCLATARRHDIKAFLELHIEQGIVLESRSLDVGIVTSIVGIRRIEIVFAGAADHAGTTPMALRRDALIAAANTAVTVRRVAEQLAAAGLDYFVATVGILTVEPGAANTVPGRCRLVIDARTTNPALTGKFVDEIERESKRHAEQARVLRAPLVTLSDGPPAACDPGLRAVLHECADELGLIAADLASGAGHDTAFMSRLCPSAMVFVPCRNGKSHAPEEWADRDAIGAGAAIVLQAVKSLDRSLRRDARTEEGAR